MESCNYRNYRKYCNYDDCLILKLLENTMLMLDLDNVLEQELNELAKQDDKSVIQFIKDLILERIEDAQDAALGDAAMDRLLRGESTTIPYSEVKRRLHEMDN